MKYIGAYCMVALSGVEVTKESVKKVLESVSIKVDEEKLSGLIESLKGKTLNEVIASGMSKVSNMSAGAGAVKSAVVEKKAAVPV
jgi:large subunit ribosomal protein LP2